jgi:hypothetical protein
MSAHTLHDTQSCYLVLQYLLHSSSYLSYQTQCHGTYVIIPERKNFISTTPSSLAPSNQPKQHQRSTRKSHRTDVGFCQNIVG